MNLATLILYGTINIAMIASCLISRSYRIFEFPFWAGCIAMGWFYPQAIGGYMNASLYPYHAYWEGMLFASLCTLAMWGGFYKTANTVQVKPTWLDASFDIRKLIQVGAVLCMCGFFFQYKLLSLPEEVLAETQWSGAAVKYLFFANIFVFGFITLWLVYLSEGKWVSLPLLAFIVPSVLLLLNSVIIHGRRAEMMNMFAYVAASLWFVRRFRIPRWVLVCGIAGGLMLVNAIGTYRSIMENNDVPLSQRLRDASEADYTASSEKVLEESGEEFDNYIFFRQVYADHGKYDFGLVHWNGFVFNYVPAQLVGRTVKNAMMIPVDINVFDLAEKDYGHICGTGTTLTGFTDAFASFGWFGFIKFLVIGLMMGVLYRHAMNGFFLGQLLYVYTLATSMHAITHATHSILVSIWVYFFGLGYPALLYAKVRHAWAAPAPAGTGRME